MAVKTVVNVPGPVIDPLLIISEAGLLFTPPRFRVPPLTVTACEARLSITPGDKVPWLITIPFENRFAELFRFRVPDPALVRLVPVRLPPPNVTIAALFVMVTAPAVTPPASTVIVAEEFNAASSLVVKATGVPVPPMSQFCAVVFQIPALTAGFQVSPSVVLITTTVLVIVPPLK